MTKKIRDISKDVISNQNLDYIEEQVRKDVAYGDETRLITNCLKRFLENTDIEIVAMKIGLIDITNSTHISQHKSKINAYDFAKHIISVPNIDERIKNGDPSVVNDIAKCNGKINLFSFASKYCCYHNHDVYEHDDFSILDTVLAQYLPIYFKGKVKKAHIEKWRKNFMYEKYNDFITQMLDELNITTEFRRRKFDHFIWFLNRGI